MLAGDEECLGFVWGQGDLPAITPGCDCLQCIVDTVHSVLPVMLVTCKGESAVISVCLGFRDELENVINPLRTEAVK